MQLTKAILQTLVICQIWSLKHLKGETIENLINKVHFNGNLATGKFLTFTTIWSTQAWFIFFVFGYENEENSNMFNVMSIEAPEILDLQFGFPTKFEVGQNMVSTARNWWINIGVEWCLFLSEAFDFINFVK